MFLPAKPGYYYLYRIISPETLITLSCRSCRITMVAGRIFVRLCQHGGSIDLNGWNVNHQKAG
jgi:hypothetical protein